jgi:hypothetical protein
MDRVKETMAPLLGYIDQGRFLRMRDGRGVDNGAAALRWGSALRHRSRRRSCFQGVEKLFRDVRMLFGVLHGGVVDENIDSPS